MAMKLRVSTRTGHPTSVSRWFTSRLFLTLLLLCGVLRVHSLADHAAEAALPPIQEPRDFLNLYGVDESLWNRVEDGRPIHSDERELILRLLYLTDRLRTVDRGQWTYRDFELTSLVNAPDRARGELFVARGRVQAVEARQPVPELVERFEFDRYYECQFVVDDGTRAIVMARDVADAWKPSKTLDEPASFTGLFVKLASGDGKEPLPVFVTQHVAWHPDNLLGRLGMDVALLDDLRTTGP
jgi:hypothetical protein